MAVSVSVLALTAVGGLWLSRVPIATGVIDRELARRGVTARYEVADLGFGRQRLTNVVIGDPGNPDLVADWVETLTDIGLSGPRLVALRAGKVRIRGRMIDGRVTLGEIDRLLPASRGGPFALPALDVAVSDARMRLDTPYGAAGIALSGRGRLDDGFAGTMAVVAPRLGVGDCAARGVTAHGRVRSTGKATGNATRKGEAGYGIDFAGPVRGAMLACAGTRVASLAADARARLVLGNLAASTLSAGLTTGAVIHPQARTAGITGTVAARIVDGSVRGDVAFAARDVTGSGVRARRAAIDGGFGADARNVQYKGIVGIDDADARTLLPTLGGVGAGSPVAPLIRRADIALTRAAARFSGRADVSVSQADGELRVLVGSARATAASGARMTFGGDAPLAWRDGRLTGGGRLALGGGGLPQATVAFDKAAAWTGVATIAPYAADGAAIALTPVRFGAGRLSTTATLTGPIAGGRVERLVLPIDARRAGGTWRIDPACTPVAFDRLILSGLTLDPARLALCPTGEALVAVGPAGVTGGARIAAPRLTGTLGGTPLTLAAADARVALSTRGFSADDVSARIGRPGAVTSLDVARIDGRVTPTGLAGTMSGGAGRIGAVPLVMFAATGTWNLVGGRFGLTGALTVADAAPAAERRFNPLAARDVAFGLADGEIGVAGRLVEPVTGVEVARVGIGHRLSTGTGHAAIDVPGIAFGDALQPDRLTLLTFGVIADVKGIVKGRGDIDWSPAGVTSTGTFSTADTDLAAAFGPVEGLAGTIRFTDLLALESAPGQVATVASINTGVPVTNGRIVYQTLPDTRVKVDGGTWPFAGGTLTLDPTLLDFAKDQSRRMTFRIAGMDAAGFIEQFDFENLSATGTFDGVLPMTFDADGGRIVGGRLTARAPGGTLAYVGRISQEKLGFWGDFAFQALKSLTYRELDIAMNGPLSGEMVTDVRVAGIRQGEGAKSNFLIRRLTRLPIRFDIRIAAPFRGLIDSAAGFYDPSRLVKRNLQQLIDAQNAAPVQPPESEIVP